MNTTMTILIYVAFIFIVFLIFCVLYLVFIYRRLLDKYHNLLLREHKSELKRNIERNAMKFADTRTEQAISKATEDAVALISKNAKNVSNLIKRKSLDKLIEEEQAEESSVSAEFDQARSDIEKYKAEVFTKIGNSANEIMTKVIRDSSSRFGEFLKKEDQEKLVMEALQNAKRSNIF